MFAALPAERRFALSRSAQTPQTGRLRSLDLDADADIADLLSDVTPYGLLYTIPPPSEGDGDPRLERFLTALEPAPERIVYVSTSGVYGDRGGRLTDESAPLKPATARARRRVAAEDHLRHWCDAKRVDCLVLRVPGIYGPGRLGLSRLREGASVLRAADAGPGNRIHVDDLMRCCLAALTGSAPAGAYNVGDGDHRSSSEFTAAIASIAGLPAPTEISLAQAQEQWSPARLSFLNESRRLDLSRMRERLGVEPDYADVEQGIRASLNDEA